MGVESRGEKGSNGRLLQETYERIRETGISEHSYFEQKTDAVGALGASTDQKIAAALRQLTQGISGDSTVEYVRLSESTAAVCLKRFCSAVVSGLKNDFLRLPNLS
jgi:hypothetical protein